MGDSGWVSFDPADPNRSVGEAFSSAVRFDPTVPNTIPPHLPEGAMRPAVKGSDPDYGAILSFDLRNERITFASHDRRSHVSMDWDALPSHAGEMTKREWTGINEGLRKYAGTAAGVASVGSMPTTPSPALSAPRASEPGGARTIRDQAKDVMTALTAMGATTDDALAIILSEISAAEDPRAAAAAWVTRFTDDVMAVLREHDAEQG